MKRKEERDRQFDDTVILTFDDITQAQLDQRRAAWSDIARRIAHEIKNPLTPIQLSAERIRRKFRKEVPPADLETFDRCTDTIVRQVSDIGRMVDEFSSFARMPKPLFRPESLLDIARQSMLYGQPADPARWGVLLAWTAALLVIGVVFFWMAEETYGEER